MRGPYQSLIAGACGANDPDQFEHIILGTSSLRRPSKDLLYEDCDRQPPNAGPASRDAVLPRPFGGAVSSGNQALLVNPQAGLGFDLEESIATN